MVRLKRLNRKERRILGELQENVERTIDEMASDIIDPEDDAHAYVYRNVKRFQIWPAETREYYIYKHIDKDLDSVEYGIAIDISGQHVAVVRHVYKIGDNIIWQKDDMVYDITIELLCLLAYEEKTDK